MTSPLQDLRFALRQMLPGFVLTVLGALALAITANVIVFGALQPLVPRPMDAPRPDRTVTLAHAGQNHPTSSYQEVRDLRNGDSVFSAVAAWGVSKFGLEANGVISFHVAISSRRGRP